MTSDDEQGPGGSGQGGYPEGDPEGPGDQRGGEETDTSGAPDTSSPEEGGPDQATGNPGAAG